MRYQGGRLKPKHWLDVFGLVEEAAKKKNEKLEKAEKDDAKQVVDNGAIKEKQAPEAQGEAVAGVNEEGMNTASGVEDGETEDDKAARAETPKGAAAAPEPDVQTVDEKVATELNGVK